MPVHMIEHPLAQDKLTRLRNKKTHPSEFRRLVMEMARILVLEATRDVKLKDVVVETPLATTSGKKLAEAITLLPIMRAGLAMVEGCLQLMPSAPVGHIGIYRDKLVKNTVEYYLRLPGDIDHARVFILEPLIGTGDTACATVCRLKEYGVKRIDFLCILAAKAGLDKLFAEHPDIHVFTIGVDPDVNEQAYILPGLGDAGDRLYGTIESE